MKRYDVSGEKKMNWTDPDSLTLFSISMFRSKKSRNHPTSNSLNVQK
jgi:hypothetical protein